jgi:hypothetical protein
MKPGRVTMLAMMLIVLACRDKSARRRGGHSSLASSGPSSDARDVCDTILARWRQIHFAVAELRDSVANPSNRSSVEQDKPEEQLPPTPACLVIARTDSGLDDDLRTPYWPAPGWVPLLMFSADGPDGRMLNYQRGMVRCQVEDSFDGGDDADTTVVPLKWFAQRTTCWRHNRPLTATDTGRPP